MSISFKDSEKLFIIETLNTKYMFKIIEDKYPVHLYYGNENCEECDYIFESRGFCPYYEELEKTYSADTCMSEYIGFDSGDFRTSSLKIKNHNGDSAVFLTYKGYNIFKGRKELAGLPFAEADDNTETLEIYLVDDLSGISVRLYYTVFYNCDVITRYVKVTNNGENSAVIEKIASLTLDLPSHDFDMISLYGSWFKERNYQRNPIMYGSQSIFSRRGASSHQFNPFFALCDKKATESEGSVYGFNFVYSGNFLDEVEVDQTGKTRVQISLGSENFNWQLKVGESFITPEAVMTYSDSGIGQMSRNFHKFIRNHILPPEPFEKRPIVINPWEACYFDINEEVMLRFAKTAAYCGMDMVVMDDGWFGMRNNDDAGLGDWYANKDKFKNGLKSFVDKMKSHGIKFGIWIEPEMVNPDSDLYRAHPDWIIHCKDRKSMLTRKQLVLDMGNPDVLDYLKNTFSKTFEGVSLDYFKWDMNRHMSQVGSAVLPAERQGEAAFRYMLGVYELFRWFHEKYPNAMIENCSGGGGRYDLGMMKYSTMIWTSDNSWCRDRIRIQYSSMLAYPASTMSCHVANLEHCENPEHLKYIYEVALGGALGYELHLPNASDELRMSIKTQIENYRKYEDLILRGEYFTLSNPFKTNYSIYYYTDEKRDRILLSFLQQEAEEPKTVTIKVTEAKDGEYYDEINDLTITGEEMRNGITVYSQNSEWNSKMWYLIRK